MLLVISALANHSQEWLGQFMVTTNDSLIPITRHTPVLIQLIFQCIYILLILLCVGVYFTGDGALRDGDGHYQITGRVDDVINAKGHRLGTAEVESAMVK